MCICIFLFIKYWEYSLIDNQLVNHEKLFLKGRAHKQEIFREKRGYVLSSIKKINRKTQYFMIFECTMTFLEFNRMKKR